MTMTMNNDEIEKRLACDENRWTKIAQSQNRQHAETLKLHENVLNQVGDLFGLFRQQQEQIIKLKLQIKELEAKIKNE